jgi:hypothetical protein
LSFNIFKGILKGLDQILNIFRQVALIDGHLDDAEIEFMQTFLNACGLNYSFEDVKTQILSGEQGDLIGLRESLVTYIQLDPPYLQLTWMRDLLTTLVEADAHISAEEELILSELNGLIDNQLETVGIQTLYKVFIVPTTPQQEDAIRALLPKAKRVDNPWGRAYLCDIYYSKEYAEMVLNRYRSINLYAILEIE